MIKKLVIVTLVFATSIAGLGPAANASGPSRNQGAIPFDDGIRPTPPPGFNQVNLGLNPILAYILSSTSNSPEFPIKHYALIVPQPTGYSTNSCWRKEASSSENIYMCRYIQSSTIYISKTSSLIRETSEHDPNYGTMLVLGSSTYEGCRTHHGSYWRCSYRANQLWSKHTSPAGIRNYYFPAFNRVDLITKARCAVQIVRTWNPSAISGSTIADLITSCRSVLSS